MLSLNLPKPVLCCSSRFARYSENLSGKDSKFLVVRWFLKLTVMLGKQLDWIPLPTYWFLQPSPMRALYRALVLDPFLPAGTCSFSVPSCFCSGTTQILCKFLACSKVCVGLELADWCMRLIPLHGLHRAATSNRSAVCGVIGLWESIIKIFNVPN